MINSFYILPVHNKEELIIDVLQGIKNSQGNATKPSIICVIDGCTDNTEQKIKEFEFEDIHYIQLNDVHEIECLNTGLQYIKDNLDPKPNDLVFMVQDDVILDENDIDLKFKELFDSRDDLGYITMRLGVSVFVDGGEIKESDYIESEFGHWNQLNWNFHKVVRHGEFVESEIAIRSPTCTQWKRFEEVGVFDFNLAPCGFDCHDFSIRMNQAGYVNGIFAMRFRSDVNWGSMRQDKPTEYPSEKVGYIYERNRKYLANKHSLYFGR